MAWVKNNFDEAEFEGAKIKFKSEIREDWREAGRRMLTELEKADKTILFLFDELPAMLDRIIEKQGESSARDFLAWFRTVRLEQKDVLRRHRFIVAGSVGIDQILRKLGATDTINAAKQDVTAEVKRLTNGATVTSYMVGMKYPMPGMQGG